MKLFSLIILTAAASSVAQAQINKDQTIVNITNDSSKAVELRIKAKFEDVHGQSTKGGGVRITVEPGKQASVDLKSATQRFREDVAEGKGQINQELTTLRKIDAVNLKSVEILKVVGVNAQGETLFKIFTQQPKEKANKTIYPEFMLADNLVLSDLESGVILKVQ